MVDFGRRQALFAALGFPSILPACSGLGPAAPQSNAATHPKTFSFIPQTGQRLQYFWGVPVRGNAQEKPEIAVVEDPQRQTIAVISVSPASSQATIDAIARDAQGRLNLNTLVSVRARPICDARGRVTFVFNSARGYNRGTPRTFDLTADAPEVVKALEDAYAYFNGAREAVLGQYGNRFVMVNDTGQACTSTIRGIVTGREITRVALGMNMQGWPSMFATYENPEMRMRADYGRGLAAYSFEFNVSYSSGGQPGAGIFAASFSTNNPDFPSILDAFAERINDTRLSPGVTRLDQGERQLLVFALALKAARAIGITNQKIRAEIPPQLRTIFGPSVTRDPGYPREAPADPDDILRSTQELTRFLPPQTLYARRPQLPSGQQPPSGKFGGQQPR